MVMVSKFSNFPDELSENDELREYELGGSDSKHLPLFRTKKIYYVLDGNVQNPLIFSTA